MAASKQNLLSRIPAVEILLQEAESQGWTAGIPRRVLVDSVRVAVDRRESGCSNRPPSEKGTVPICRNGPKGAWHKWGLSPFRTARS